MSENECSFPVPPEYLARLARNLGRWQVKSRFFMAGPDAPPFENEAEELVEPIGPYWTIGHYRAEMMGMSMVGRATFGFDLVKNKWVGSWMDSFGPFAFFFEGDADPSLKAITMHSVAGNPQTLELNRYRTVETEIDNDHRRFEMYRSPLEGGAETLMFINDYSRKG